MESMEEILDLEELQVDVIDENLKEFMSKDYEAETLLKEKIDEITVEENKLTSKENEVKKLEESNREKISSNASPDELIEIAQLLKDAQSELQDITGNIKKLEEEKQDLVSTKENIENSKQEYIKNLNSTSMLYHEQIKKISDAIEVCDNASLKQALEDVKGEKEKQLYELQENRNNVLKTVLSPVNLDSDNELEEKEQMISVDTNIEENSILNEVNNNDIVTDDALDQDSDNNMIKLDSILLNPLYEESNINETISKIEDTTVVLPSLNEINTENIVMPENVPSKGVKIIFEKDVEENAINEILSSSSIMPIIYSYLSVNDNEGGIEL